MQNWLKIQGARVHNLQNVSLSIPRDQLVVFTGLSGSGKSSLAFDTIYAEGQRRYVESLSAYARQFLGQLDKPDVDFIEGLSPAISIDQKSASHNPRSTVGTVTEIYDYLRLLFASIGVPHCPQCKRPIQKQSVQEIVDQLMAFPPESSILLLAPVVSGKKGEYKQLLEKVRKDGFSRVRINGEIHRLDESIDLEKHKKHVIEIVVDRLVIQPDAASRITDSVETCSRHGNGLVQVENLTSGTSHLFSEDFACPYCQKSLQEISPRLFSFNSPYGACPSCNGLGDAFDFDPDLIFENRSWPIRKSTQKCVNLDDTYYGRHASLAAKAHGFTLDTPVKKLTPEQMNVLLYGHEEPFTQKINPMDYHDSRYLDAGWEGIIPNLRRRHYQTSSEGMRLFFRGFMSSAPCTVCHGARLKSEALCITIRDKSISDLTTLSITDLLSFFKTIRLTDHELKISAQILKEINNRLGFLTNVGLNYLNLHRRAGTLSGGEFQRIRLATQIGSGLTGVLYVLDEPSIGLHQRDNQRLIQTLMKLKELGNTLIVVEHDEDTIRASDFVVDIGPRAGVNGGQVVFAGPLADFLKSDSLTAQYLTGKAKIEVPAQRRVFSKPKFLTLYGASENNLKGVTAQFPLGKFVCVTGVSGSGKSTLINGILQKILAKHFHQNRERPGAYERIEGIENVDTMIVIDQSPIGRTPRSNPATYTGIFTPIRELFAETKEAKIRGYKPGRFSFNVRGGRCEACEGDGMLKIEMHFLSDVYVTCDVCKGRRYNSETLQVKFKGYAISDVLDMTVNQAAELFENFPAIISRLKTLQAVGLGYIHLGQSATTLSGGEAQRIKLSKELSKRHTGKTLYLLDEPTTGLHFEDVKRLLAVLHRLVDAGNTVIVIEHNLDVIKTSDHIIDLGPEGGEGGGMIVAEGTPEEVARSERSYTGRFLAGLLSC